MGLLAGLLSSSGLGAITGLLGTALNKGFALVDAKNQRIEAAAQRAENAEIRAHELATINAHAEVDAEAREAQKNILDLTARAAERLASIQSEAQSAASRSRWVNDFAGMVRPVLTFGLIGALVAAWYTVPATEGTHAALMAQSLDTLCYLASTAVTWWFGDRAQPSAQPAANVVAMRRAA